MLIDSDLKMDLFMGLSISLEEYVSMIASAKSQKKRDKLYREYEKCQRLYNIGLKMLIDGNLTAWDWKFADDAGWLCNLDFEWFKIELKKKGIKNESKTRVRK